MMNFQGFKLIQVFNVLNLCDLVVGQI